MKYVSCDYNSINNLKSNIWNEISLLINNLKAYLKDSDQKGKKNSLIFDPKGTNEAIKKYLSNKNWTTNWKIPDNFNTLGKDIDFFKKGVLLEVQFSNYPFLLNNVVRSELFFKNKEILKKKIECLVIITKVHAFPSSNSTLYFEQAKKQLDLLSNSKLFSIPIKLIGLTCEENKKNKIIWSKYKEARYSRESVERKLMTLRVSKKRKKSFFTFK